jgi:hypothetical protein
MIRLKMRDILFFAIATPILVFSFNNCAPYDESAMVWGQQLQLSSEALAAQGEAFAVLKANRCNACHGTRPGTMGVYLYDTNQLIQNGHIIPGDYQASQVYQNTGGGHNSVPAFSAGDRATIANWIIALKPDPNATPVPTPIPGTTPTPTATPVPTATPIGATPTPTPTPTPVANIAPCTLTASVSSNVVPGDAVVLTMTWPMPATGTVQSATIDAMNYSVSGKTSQVKQVNPSATKTYIASYKTDVGDIGICSTSVATKATASLTKDEYFRATIGPGSQSVASMIMIGRCQNCHSSSGNTPSAQAMTYLVIDPFSAATTLSRIKAAKTPIGTTIDLTVKTATSNGLYQFASGHKPKSPAYTSADLQHILGYVTKP